MINIYRVRLTNFGYFIYEGRDEQLARKKAEMAGFECTIYTNDVLTGSFSPITGWLRHWPTSF
jgi:hypothetical protein